MARTHSAEIALAFSDFYVSHCSNINYSHQFQHKKLILERTPLSLNDNVLYIKITLAELTLAIKRTHPATIGPDSFHINI